MGNVNVKVCSECNVCKPLDSFHVCNRNKSGRAAKCKDCRSALAKDYYKDNKLRINKRNQKWNSNNKEYKREIGRKYYYENIDSAVQYRKANQSRTNVRRVQKRREHPLEKMKHALRNRVRKFLKIHGWRKNKKTEELVGADYETVMKHIESQFKLGMSWSNHGEWHIDHEIPLALAKTEQELIQLFHYSNLQPLWAKQNLSKGAKLFVNG